MFDLRHHPESLIKDKEYEDVIDDHMTIRKKRSRDLNCTPPKESRKMNEKSFELK